MCNYTCSIIAPKLSITISVSNIKSDECTLPGMVGCVS